MQQRTMVVSFHQATATMRTFRPDALRPRLARFVGEHIEASSAQGASDIDARDELVRDLRDVGAPWFAFVSFALPRWTWVSVPIQPDRSVDAHLRWIEMRIDDARREVERLGELFALEKVDLDPEPFVRRTLSAELPEVIAAHSNAGEVFDAIQLTCDLMIEAARLPVGEGSRAVIDDFFQAQPPSAEELREFIDALASSLARGFFHRYGSPPHGGFERELITLERRTEQLLWEIDWLQGRLRRRAFIDDEDRALLEEDLVALEGIAHGNLQRLQSSFPEAIAVLEAELEDLEGAWIGANDRDSVVTEARLDTKINAQVTRLAAHKKRFQELQELAELGFRVESSR